MGDAREFPNPYSDFSSSNDQTGGSEAELLTSLRECESRLLVQLEEGLARTDSSDNSVYTGTCGISLLYRRLSETSADDKTRQAYAGLSYRYVRSALDRRKGRRVTFACGDGGPLALGAVIYHERGNSDKSQKYLRELYGLSAKVVEDSDENGDMPDEFLYGRVGYLFALLFVYKHLGASTLDLEVIHGVVDAIVRSGRRLSAREKSKSPLMFQWHDRHYLGAAHGISGICAVLLQAVILLPEDASLRGKVEKYVRPTLDYMIGLKFPSGNYPSSLESGDKDKLIHWCHGAPGVVYSFIFAYRVFNDEKYLQCAVECGEVIWSRGLLRKGYGLCHGVAGNAYAFVALHSVTNDPKYSHRAMSFGKWMFDYGKHGCRTPDRPFSLFEGMAGTVYFFNDLQNVSDARFPAFDLT